MYKYATGHAQRTNNFRSRTWPTNTISTNCFTFFDKKQIPVVTKKSMYSTRKCIASPSCTMDWLRTPAWLVLTHGIPMSLQLEWFCWHHNYTAYNRPGGTTWPLQLPSWAIARSSLFSSLAGQEGIHGRSSCLWLFYGQGQFCSIQMPRPGNPSPMQCMIPRTGRWIFWMTGLCRHEQNFCKSR